VKISVFIVVLFGFLGWASVAFSQTLEEKFQQRIQSLENHPSHAEKKRYLETLAEPKVAARSIAPQVAEERVGVVMLFHSNSSVDLDRLQQTYGLVLQQQLPPGLYVFENHGKRSDADLVQALKQNEAAIKSVEVNTMPLQVPR